MTGKKTYVVGGNGRRSGLAASKVGNVELRILVLPKLWSKCLGDFVEIGQKPISVGRSLAIIAREGQAFGIDISQNDEKFVAALDQCFRQLVETGVRIAETQAAIDSACGNNEGDEDEAYTRRLPLINERHGGR